MEGGSRGSCRLPHQLRAHAQCRSCPGSTHVPAAPGHTQTGVCVCVRVRVRARVRVRVRVRARACPRVHLRVHALSMRTYVHQAAWQSRMMHFAARMCCMPLLCAADLTGPKP